MSEMMDENGRQKVIAVCKHHQLGFCKYGAQCHKHHVNEICSKEFCRDRECTERHPKTCKYNTRNRCKYGENCAYKHEEPNKNTEIQNLEDEIAIIKIEIEKLSKNTVEMTEKLQMIEYSNKELSDVKENVVQLSQTMNEMRMKIVNMEENKHTESSEKIPNQAERQYFKCE